MKNYYSELFQLVAHDEDAAYQKAGAILAEIQREAKWLEHQRSLVAHMHSFLGAMRAERAGPKPLGVAGVTAPDDYVSVTTTPPPGTVAPNTRSERIKNIALALAQGGLWDLDTQMVLNEMTAEGLSLGVRQPLSVIGTVLASMDDFERVGPNLFRFKRPT